MFRYLCVSTCLFFLISCIQVKPVGNFFDPNLGSNPIIEKVNFEVTLTEQEIATYEDVKTAFWDKATHKGIELLMRKLIQKHILVKGSIGQVPPPEDIHFFQKIGQVSPSKLPVTNDLVQNFSFELSFIPDWKLGGQIKKIEEDRYIAGSSDRVLVVLFDYYPLKTPAYFLIGKRVEEENNHLVSIIGTGKLIQALGPVARAKIDDKHSGTLAQGKILETTQEVLPGDLIFLVTVKAWAKPEPQTKKQIKSDTNEVVVEPKFIEEEPLPLESK
ncbi:hypothetical protein KFV02_00190 [Desulfohalobiaceae bacterium Ax17]|jgi:hypothetical protein|uniref:hypothetical protein n=1 Tax=Desulfovulcanus ferrireducens TaxID=2831190 RepID=UPI00207BAE8F|nr:hypothetical protein [Desulfovulcanus ferrireducens]MBT8762351.1 hypothetical protein [Desulfovulcanus ferrireducens]